MTAYGDMANVRTAMNQGAFDFIIKPFKKNDLKNTIQNALAEVDRFEKMILEDDFETSNEQKGSIQQLDVMIDFINNLEKFYSPDKNKQTYKADYCC